MQSTLTKKETPGQKLHPELQERRNRPWWLSATQFALTLCVGVLALETYFNFAGVGNEEFLEPDPVLGVRHIAGKKVTWRLEGFSNDHLNSKGLRDSEHSIAKEAGTYRIALLGDSATEGMQVALDETYGKQLERLLKQSGREKVEVINFGCSSYSNGQETIQLEQQVAPYKPDLVIMMYNRGDYIENIRDPNTLRSEPRPYFHMDAQDKELLQDDTIMKFNEKSFKPNPVIDFLRTNSRIYGVLTHTNLALNLNEALYSKTRNSILKLLPGSKEQWKRVQAPYVITNPWLVTQKVIERANNDCQAMGSKFMVVCFPNNVNEKEYAEQIQSLEKQSRDQNFMYLNLTPDFGGTDAKSLFLKYHFSSAGHSVAAKRIADQLN